MKVTLDLDQFPDDQEIALDEYEKLSKLLAKSTGSLAVNNLDG